MTVLSRRLAAEALGTAFLLMAVVGSGIMAERLAGGNDALALLCNTVVTGAALVVLISVFAPLSGAHFNPAVTLYFALRREIGWRDAMLYAAVQILAAIAGVPAGVMLLLLGPLTLNTSQLTEVCPALTTGEASGIVVAVGLGTKLLAT